MSIFEPFLALCFLVKSPVSIFSLLIFIISIGVPIHMFTFLNPLIIQWFSLLAILSLLVAGIIFLKHFYSNDNSIYSNYLFGIIMLLSPVLIIHNNYVLYNYHSRLYFLQSSLVNSIFDCNLHTKLPLIG